MRLLVTYLELNQSPAGPPVAPPTAIAEVRLDRLSVEDYVALYRAVGGPVQWDQRLRLAHDKLAGLLEGESIDLFLLRLDGSAVGFCEFERQGYPDIELANFGLIPEVQGRGLGRFLLDRALRAVWHHRRPFRIWLHTDTNDHPNALPLYKSFGFREFAQRIEDFPD
jgi:ribosomal protein S18 acetylase RimI-like enzyme